MEEEGHDPPRVALDATGQLAAFGDERFKCGECAERELPAFGVLGRAGFEPYDARLEVDLPPPQARERGAPVPSVYWRRDRRLPSSYPNS
jgi:hypothetical protein